MFGFGKKKSKDKKEDEVPSNLKDLKKNSLEVHIALQDKVKEYLLTDEDIITEGRLEFNSYFVTNKRILSVQALNKKLKGIQVDSIYYNNVAGIKYIESVFKKLPYDTVELEVKGTIKKAKIQLPSEVTKEIYRIVNDYISSNNI